MTKDQYFEMCEMLGNEPNEDEIPLEFEDLHTEVQEALQVYNMLQDNIDTMNGIYLGKVLTGFSEIMDLAGVDDKRSCYMIIAILDQERSAIMNKKKATK